MSIELATRTCNMCGETKPVSQFYVDRTRNNYVHARCKLCETARVTASKERRRERIGDDEYKAMVRDVVRAHRERTGNKHGIEYNRAVSAANKALRGRHRAEYDHLLVLARRGELGTIAVSHESHDN